MADNRPRILVPGRMNQRVLDRLPARTRVIWILRHVLAEPLPAIVELSACSQSTVQRRLREAEALLEEALRHA